MRKIFIAASMFLAVQVASAQTASYKADTIEVLKRSGAAAGITAVLEPIIEQIPADRRADFIKDFESILPSLYEQMAENMMKYYTHDDILKMLEFYNSPVGEKMQKHSKELTEEQMKAGENWGLQLQGILSKYFQ